ncbi:hypothetical protein [Chryseobacterium pennipullorum]|uniref:Uncharacterized protein n=1 Tax=Chryseobacterium pennipullorum TaxID=2258963 RepID=A0A3D9B7H2_9FLAO|nr:hypothetical protein [Chryseobacterium pennipullorum]REC49483.1 hypothetical protein DRF67_03110 [Chryseobacterium pennipullorum]
MEKRIIYIPEEEYECYYLDDRWKIIHKGKTNKIYADSIYGVPFYIIFEYIEDVSKQLTTLIHTYDVSLSDIFPVQLILEELIEHQQNYWLNLYVDFIVEINVLNQDMIKALLKTKNNKVFTQSVRHKIKKVILTHKYEY